MYISVRVQSVSCGAEHTVALCTEGVSPLYCITYFDIVCLLSDIFMGFFNTWSSMYFIGISHYLLIVYQLGLGDTLKRTRPVQIASLANVTMITVVCGHYHCIGVDENHWYHNM